MGISISNLIYTVLSLVVASFVLLFSIGWFVLKSGIVNSKNNERDEKLFKQPPPEEDCLICFLRIPTLKTGSRYQSCCGKEICSGCIHAPVYDHQGNKVDNKKCPFCRAQTPSSEKAAIERYKKRVEANDPVAIHDIGVHYFTSTNGYPQDYVKALELWHRAGKLGYATAYCNIGIAYFNGQGMEVDKKKAMHYFELAALGGCVRGRYSLGVYAGNVERALKHFMIAVRDGHADSLKNIKELYSDGHATKEDYSKALQLYQIYLGEIKSEQRDEAAEYDNERYRYY